MTVPQLTFNHRVFNSPLEQGISWFDADTSCTVVVSSPSADRALWADFIDGAARSYHKNGIERALGIESLQDDANTQLCHVVVNDNGAIMAGIRAKGPLESADESHAIVEWEDRPGLRTVRKMLTDRLPFGVVEMKTAWMSDDPNRSRALGSTLARAPFTTMALLDVVHGAVSNSHGTVAVAPDVHTEFLSAGRPGDRLVAEGVEVHRTARTAVFTSVRPSRCPASASRGSASRASVRGTWRRGSALTGARVCAAAPRPRTARPGGRWTPRAGARGGGGRESNPPDRGARPRRL